MNQIIIIFIQEIIFEKKISGLSVVMSAPVYPGLILGLHPTNERHLYNATPSLIGRVQT